MDNQDQDSGEAGMSIQQDAANNLVAKATIAGHQITFMVNRNILTRLTDEALATVAGGVVYLFKHTAEAYTAVVKILDHTETAVEAVVQFGEEVRRHYIPIFGPAVASQYALNLARSGFFDPEIEGMQVRRTMRRLVIRIEADIASLPEC